MESKVSELEDKLRDQWQTTTPGSSSNRDPWLIAPSTPSTVSTVMSPEEYLAVSVAASWNQKKQRSQRRTVTKAKSRWTKLKTQSKGVHQRKTNCLRACDSDACKTWSISCQAKTCQSAISILPNLENGARLAAKENKTNIKLNWSQHRLIAQLGKSHSVRYLAVKDLQATL